MWTEETLRMVEVAGIVGGAVCAVAAFWFRSTAESIAEKVVEKRLGEHMRMQEETEGRLVAEWKQMINRLEEKLEPLTALPVQIARLEQRVEDALNGGKPWDHKTERRRGNG